MSYEILFFCDSCKRVLDKGWGFYYVPYSLEAVKRKQLELCNDCCGSLLQGLLGEMTREQGDAWLEALGKGEG